MKYLPYYKVAYNRCYRGPEGGGVGFSWGVQKDPTEDVEYEPDLVKEEDQMKVGKEQNIPAGGQ